MRFLLTATMLSLCFQATSFAACTPAGMDRAALTTLKGSQWKVDDDSRRQVIALTMLDCLADPDPVLRDEMAFEALSTWGRGQKLAPATLQTMYQSLLAKLEGPGDAQGFAQPFAALALAEVARVDRLQAFLTPAQRQAMVSGAAAYLTGIKDYRGFDAGAGWRHGVAHGADLMLQLALNPALDRAQQDTLLKAIASQVIQSNHAYRYGEGERLMAPVFYLGARSAHTASDWDDWFATLSATPADEGSNMQATLTRQHNVKAFLYALYAGLQESPNPLPKQKMLPALVRALKKLG